MKYIFLHIGKTAGTSFRYFLIQNIPKAFHGYDALPELPLHPDKVSNDVIKRFTPLFEHYDCFSAHIGYGLHQYLPENTPYTYLTVLREPVARTLSTYRYGIQRGWIDPGQDILSWLDESRSYLEYQLDYLAGAYYVDSPSQEKAEKALERLTLDSFVYGFSDDLDGFIDICCQRFESFQPYKERLNETVVQADFTDVELNELAQMLEVERTFYDQAKALYRQKYIC